MVYWTATHSDGIDWVNRCVWVCVVVVVGVMILRARRSTIAKGIPEATFVCLAIAALYTKMDMVGRDDAHYYRFFLLSIVAVKIPLAIFLWCLVYCMLRFFARKTK